ncbi:hypothetical protein [Streptomyces hydrogenans]|uniref:hypothetical protein n=1 Tax=Streptomyces hydrogenans TaxID=1873719 RepID=UPI00381FA95B
MVNHRPGDTYVYCFSHGLPHVFEADKERTCEATWVPFNVASAEELLEAKEAAYGDAQFFDQLTLSQKLEVLEIRDTWTEEPAPQQTLRGSLARVP